MSSTVAPGDVSIAVSRGLPARFDDPDNSTGAGARGVGE